LKQLQDLGVDISSGRLSQFITGGLDMFHDEKDQLLQRDYRYPSMFIPMTRARGMMAKTAIAHTSAMNCLPGLAAPKAKAASTF